MMKKFRMKHLILLLLVLCIIYASIVLVLSLITKPDRKAILEHELISYETGQSYFNSETVLMEIENGDDDVFFETELSPGKKPPVDYINATILKDIDLYEIIQYYLQNELLENSNDWRLVKIVYSLSTCEKGFNGAYSTGYIFQKNIIIDEKTCVDERGIGITNWENMIDWYGKVECGDNLSTEINWEEINYHATDVYSIAEENGGYEIHSNLESNCNDIIMCLYTNGDWYVDYGDELGFNLLELKIDSKTGEVKK